MSEAGDEAMDQLSELRNLLVKFREERDWEQFHTLKNLCAALSIEAAELQELTLWKKDSESSEALQDKEFIEHLKEECADVFIFLVLIANLADIDLIGAAIEKVHKNADRYPVEKAKGIATKYDQL